MMDDPFTPEELELIERLSAAPRPRIRPTARDAIRERIIHELHAPTVPVQRPFDNLLHLTTRLAAALVAVVAIGLLVLALVQVANQPTATGETATALPALANRVAVVPTDTLGLSTGSAAPMVGESPTLSSVPESTSSMIATTQSPAPLPTPVTATATLETVVVVEGPVTNIVNNVITIYDYPIEVEPQHPILAVIDIGDTVRVEGTLDSTGQVLASAVGNIPSTEIVSGDTEATVRLDGPVEAIDGSLITVNGIPVQIEPDDPFLQTVQVGDFVSLQGNFEGSGSNIVLVVVNITIVNNVIINGVPFCWYHVDAMGMGHWHCDGMCMGMGEPPPPPGGMGG